MSTYAIGDIQGCYEPLRRLLEKLRFAPSRDHLWFTGDLVNRGGQSLEVLRWCYRHRDHVTVVLGNHDLHLLALAAGVVERTEPELHTVVNARDGTRLLDWLRHRPLLHRDRARRLTLVHAGLHPSWKLKRAALLAAEVTTLLQRKDWRQRIAQLYLKRRPWNDRLTGAARRCSLAAIFTRMRFLGPEGEFDDVQNGPPGSQPSGLHPWFELPNVRGRKQTVLFGHWAALGYHAAPGAVGLDSGCVWGGALTAINVNKPNKPITVPGLPPSLRATG